MLHDMKKTTLTLAILVTGMAAATAQAGDIRPLHHDCFNANIANWPKPSANGPANTGGGSGALGVAAGATDIIRFTCPVGFRAPFEYRVRTKNARWVRAYTIAPWPATSTSDLWWGAPHNDLSLVAISNAYGNTSNLLGSHTDKFVPLNAAGQVEIRVSKTGGLATSTRNYELCVSCESPAGAAAQPTGAYLQNQ
jgi:hypothetical protein